MTLKPRKIAVLGATGSVGQTTLGLVRDVNVAASGFAHDGPLSVEVVTANRNIDALAQIALEFRPQRAVIGDEAGFEALASKLAGTGIEVCAGASAMVEAGSGEADWVMAAIVGAAGLAPTLKAVQRGATIALANKECLVCAGPLFIDEVARSGATLLSADSEHNAIFQMFDFDQPQTIEKVTLTASGGPFRTWDLCDLKTVTPAQAVKHPNWNMGAKISVDSATLMNKGLEVIEAYYLFPIEKHQIDVVIHPQSIVHSFISHVDGSVLAQLGTPDMAIPVAHTLAWPARMTTSATKLDLAKMGTISFEAPDHGRFPALGLARDALQSGGAAPTILNAANEIAVAEFLAGRMGFQDIVGVVEETLNGLGHGESLSKDLPANLDSVMEIDRAARQWALRHARQITAA